MKNSEATTFKDPERLRAELKIIQQTSLKLTSSLDLTDVLNYIAESALDLIGAMNCHIYLYDQKRDQLTFGTASWRNAHQGPALKEPRPGGLIRTVIQQRAPLFISDVKNHPLFPTTQAELWDFQSIAGIPLKKGDDVIGAFSITIYETHEFDDHEQRTLSLLADQAAIAIANAQLHQMTEQRVAELEAMRRISLQLTASLDLTAVLDTIVESAMELVDASNCHIYLYDEEQDEITFSTALWEDGQREPAVAMPRPDGLTANVIRRGEPIIIPNAKDHPFYSPREAQKWGLESIAGFPLKSADRVLGAFSITFLKPHHFSPNGLRLLNLLADQATIAIENAHLYRDVLAHKEQLEEKILERTAELQARNEELAAYDHTVAHDLKSPLALVLGYIEVFEMPDIEITAENRKEYLGVIAQSARKMQNIIDELLLLAGVRDQEVTREPLSMDDIVEEALHRLQYMFKEYAGELTVPVQWPTVIGHAPWVEEIWVNYLSNALKYGGAPPVVEMGYTEDAQDSIKFWVKDNGHGLTESEQSQLFKPFERLDQMRVDGHGLGLSIVQRISQKLDGEAGVKSEIGVGSTFYFTLPRVKS